MSILVSGSLALDHIMVFPDRFENHILPDKLHMLNVAFNIESLDTQFGGVAGNIAFLLRCLGADPLILATVGNDFGSYAEWLDRHGIRRDAIRILPDVRTSQAFVTTDLDDNQIWAFYEGAMARAHEASIAELEPEASLAIVSADGKQAMLDHARELKRRGISTYVDPSHGLPMLDGPELLEMLEGCTAYVVNDYEWSLTVEKTGLSEEQLGERCETVVITKGEHGSEIREGARSMHIPAVSAAQIVDPTGCGDAYRAGLLFGRSEGHGWDVAGRMGSLFGALQIQTAGAQNLEIDLDEFRSRYESEFGAPF
ncbi:MAG: carbohydrate kinase family protein [Myxococcota bacterium]|jgi:adenosine kinase|nr:carbohydrate kinase family protein [Myxococcota bacterium]MDP6243983.1 carbohydrate kinase family protein [Myxococcota bacterium]MDP7075778.1 carbohydrate kinase family protein [Myxococcota bacterium]MDP7299951.1 carbohydrate kinase family protein [Myxococcota bacterium]